MKKIFVKILLFFGFFLFGINSTYGLGSWFTGFKIKNTNFTKIDAHSICKKVKSKSSLQYFIPTKTSNEWSSFRNTMSNRVFFEDCCSTEIIRLNTISDFEKIGNITAYNDPNYGIYITSKAEGRGPSGEHRLKYKIPEGKKMTHFKAKLSGSYIGGIGYIGVGIKYKNGNNHSLIVMADAWNNTPQGQILRKEMSIFGMI